MALETKLCHVLGFADHLGSDIGVHKAFSHKSYPTMGQPSRCGRSFYTPYHPQHLSAKGRNGLLQIIPASLPPPGPQTLVSILVAKCGCPLKVFISSWSSIS